MKQYLFWLFVLLLAAINWAALHDISKGEQDVWLEWSLVIGSVLLLYRFLARRFSHTA